MTAEVAILNTTGIALAADSAVTRSEGTRKKIYSSAEKIFEISSDTPIGLMTYNTASFLKLPWETVIKAYRHHRAGAVFKTVQECVQDFFSFLPDAWSMLPEGLRRDGVRELLHTHSLILLQRFEKHLQARLEKSGKLTESEVKDEFRTFISEVLKEIKDKEIVHGLNQSTAKSVREEYSDLIEEVKTSLFGEVRNYKSNSRQVGHVLVELLRRQYFGAMDAGLVFAGFGSDEYMPHLVEVFVEGMVCNKVRYSVGREEVVDESCTSSVLAFAQRKEVQTFMEGVSHGLFAQILRSQQDITSQIVDRIADAIESEASSLAVRLRKNKQKIANANARDLAVQIREHQEGYWVPIVQMVAALPKDEMATMASNLVNLTKFRQRVNPVDETVGGPIDVVVITKGDGFVWVQRKHYYEPHINPRAIERLRNSVRGGQND